MDGKQVGVIITLILLVPTLISLMIWTNHISKDPTNPKNIEEGVNMAVNDAIPWWLGIFEWLAGLGTIGVFLIIGFVFFLKWIGEIR